LSGFSFESVDEEEEEVVELSLSEVGGVYGHAEAEEDGCVIATGGVGAALPDESLVCMGHPGY